MIELVDDGFAGVTDSDAVCLQASVPGADVNEYCSTHDGELGRRLLQLNGLLSLACGSHSALVYLFFIVPQFSY